MKKKPIRPAATTSTPSVDVPHPAYQPSAKELREDLRITGTFKDAVEALVRPVNRASGDAAESPLRHSTSTSNARA